MPPPWSLTPAGVAAAISKLKQPYAASGRVLLKTCVLPSVGSMAASPMEAGARKKLPGANRVPATETPPATTLKIANFPSEAAGMGEATEIFSTLN